MNDYKSTLFQTRASLLERLRSTDDESSWTEFFDTYWRLIYHFARRSGLSSCDAEDIVQDVMVLASRKLPQFHYDPRCGSFKSWLFTLVKHQRVNRLRAQKPPLLALDASYYQMEESNNLASNTYYTSEIAVGDTFNPTDLPRHDLDRLWDSEWDRHLINTALLRLQSRVSVKQYQMFDMHVIRDIPIDRVAANLQTSRLSVYLSKHRVGKLFREEVERVRYSSDLL